MPTDLAIAQKAKLRPVREIARKLGIPAKYIANFGDHIAKVSPEAIGALKRRKPGKYILVTAITPTHLGEGKTVTTIGLSMALNRAGKVSAACLRQPSLGPVFGIKGGAAGGGRSQAVPMEDLNLHFTGDSHAVGLAHNLLAAFIDNSVYRNNPHSIDPANITWRRVIDLNDRYLRHIHIGLSDHPEQILRNTGFDITAASEVMAILALARNIPDIRKRLGQVVPAYTRSGEPVTAERLGIAGAMAVLLKDAIKPNLIQTLEKTPCFIHTGPFANIAHGNSSIIQDMIALRSTDYAVTEAGFGADCGAEKFFNIKCRASGLEPDAAVLVCSVRALKMHSGLFEVKTGEPLPEALKRENVEAVAKGCANMEKQIQNILVFGVPVVVAINRFGSDTEQEIDAVKKAAAGAGAFDAVTSEVWAKGSRGGMGLAKAVMRAAGARRKMAFRYLYSLDEPLVEKIKKIATTIYGAADVSYSDEARKKIEFFERSGYGKLPVCMAKTQFSLTCDPGIKGRPSGFTVTVKDVRLSAGAGFVYCLCGKVLTMPGLPEHPKATEFDIDKHGRVKGLF